MSVEDNVEDNVEDSVEDSVEDNAKTSKERAIYSILSAYKDYPHKDKKHPLYMSQPTFKKVLGMLFKKLSKHLILSGDEITLPSLLGKVKIYKYRHKKKLVDHGLTNQIYGKGRGKYVYFNTNKTNNYIPTVIWSSARLKTKSYFSFKLIRSTIRYNSYCRVQPEVILYDHFNSRGYLEYDIYAKPFEVKEKKEKTEAFKKYRAEQEKLEQERRERAKSGHINKGDETCKD